MRIQAFGRSGQHGSWRQPQLPSPARAQQSARDMDADASDPRRSPRRYCTMTSLDPAAQQVEGQDLEQERRFVGVEGVGGDFADAKAAFELADDRLDAGAVVVAAGPPGGVPPPLFGGVHS